MEERMKAHLAKLSLALLSTVFLLGCQERGSEPVGPEGLGPEFGKKSCEENPNQGSCKDDKDNHEGPNVDVTLTGGITSGIISDDGTFSDIAQRATLGSDGGRVQAFNAGVGFRATIELTGALTACQKENNQERLKDYLNFVIGEREQRNEAGDFAISFQFYVQRKKRSGQFFVIWRYPDNGTDAGKGIRVRLSSDNVGAEDQNGDETKFTYHFEKGDGGWVEVRRSPSIDDDVQGNDKLTCSYESSEDLVILLDRSPS